MRIGVDLMGSDSSPLTLFEGAKQAAQQLGSSCTLVVIGTHSVIRQMRNLHEVSPFSSPIEFHAVADAIAMAEEPLQAVSHKTGSSLVVGIRLLKKRVLDAFVSAGNTGALIASASLQLEHLPGIKRPALLAVLPTVTGSVAVLDIGGNVSSKAHHLVQFAYMGAAYQECMENIAIPRVGLLNIGVEPKKGTSSVRQAYQMLLDANLSSTIKMNFVGNVEGREIFKGGIDVLVTDGFTGNVLLKTSEGVSSFIFDYIQETLDANPSEKIRQSFQDLKRYFSYTEHPGAFICGVQGIVVKCHGNASSKVMLNSILGASKLVNANLIPKLVEGLR